VFLIFFYFCDECFYIYDYVSYVLELPGNDENGDVNDTDDAGDDNADVRKDVGGIKVQVLDFNHDIMPRSCCLINNETLLKLLDANDKVIQLSSFVIHLCVILVKQGRLSLSTNGQF